MNECKRWTELGRIRKKKQRNLVRRKARQQKRLALPDTNESSSETYFHPSRQPYWPPSFKIPIIEKVQKSATNRETPNVVSLAVQKQMDKPMYVGAAGACFTQPEKDHFWDEYDILEDYTDLITEEYDIIDLSTGFCAVAADVFYNVCAQMTMTTYSCSTIPRWNRTSTTTTTTSPSWR